MMGDAWKIKEENFPETGGIEEKIRFLLNYAILAPSSHNTQPWKFSIKGNNIEVYADFTRQLPEVDPEKRELYISVGCAISNLLIAAEHFGFGYKLKYSTREEGELVAIIELYHDKREESELFSQITLRHTDRGQYEPEIEEEKLQKLKASAGLRLDLITDQKMKSEIAKLIALADRIQLGNKAFRKELASWLRHNWSKAGDGMPGYAFGIPSIMSLLGPFFIRTFDISKSQAEKDEELANNAVIGILSSEGDEKLSWVKTGIVFEKIMLTATKLGLSIAFLNQPIEVPELRRELQNLLKMAELPQLLFRIGYAKAKTKTKHTPRRELEEVVV